MNKTIEKINMDITKDFEKFYTELVQFDNHLGMNLKVHGPAQITYSLRIEKHHLASDACHGGVIAALMESALGLTALTVALQNERISSTIEFKINYFSPVKPGEILETNSGIDFVGSKLIVSSAEIIEKTTGRLVAKGIGTFNQYPLLKIEGETKSQPS